ncbi:MAG: hypothetical protein AB8C46_25155 [Burkholderiaceae bacterium]
MTVRPILSVFSGVFAVCLFASDSALARGSAIEFNDTRRSTQWHMHTGGLSRHFEQTDASGREWNENHPGIGLEFRQRRSARWDARYTVGFMQDSREQPGGYAGAAYVRQFNRNGDFSAAIGVGAYAFYRSRSWNGEMTLVPAILPTVSFGLFKNRVGVNILTIPKVSLFGKRSTPLVFAQFTFRYD